VNRKLLDALACKRTGGRPPVWLMRQAGRYLPSYQELRKKYSLETLFHDPFLSAQITKMPLEMFPQLDAAIVFSDLLVLLEVWNKKIVYPQEGGLWVCPPLQEVGELFPIQQVEIEQKLWYVLETITRLKGRLSVPLIGFCGAPFTLLCYLLEGNNHPSFPKALSWMKMHPSQCQEALEILCQAAILFAKVQIQAGVQVFQVFDSWANLLSKELFLQLALPFWKRMQEALKQYQVPILFYSRCNSIYPKEIASIEPGGISFDEQVPLITLRRQVPSTIPIQGNFSPKVLAEASYQEVYRQTKEWIEPLTQENGLIVNLGHGVLPHTPVENVQAFLKAIND